MYLLATRQDRRFKVVAVQPASTPGGPPPSAPAPGAVNSTGAHWQPEIQVVSESGLTRGLLA
jgi:hypothetical protein